jgi:hypothetical protein
MTGANAGKNPRERQAQTGEKKAKPEHSVQISRAVRRPASLHSGCRFTLRTGTVATAIIQNQFSDRLRRER